MKYSICSGSLSPPSSRNLPPMFNFKASHYYFFVVVVFLLSRGDSSIILACLEISMYTTIFFLGFCFLFDFFSPGLKAPSQQGT